MPQTRQNGIKVPINADTYNPTGDLATMADSANVVVICANQTARDALTLFEGLTVMRTDLNGVIQVYSSGAWRQPISSDFGNGLNATYIKSGTVALNTDANGYAGYTFPTAFPSTMTGCVITEASTHTTFGAVIVKYDFDTSSKTGFKCYLYAANGAAIVNATGVRLSYLATGY